MNISPGNISGQCNLKCSYSFNYSTSSCIVKNLGNNLLLSYDSSSNPPVTFNNAKYSIYNVEIYAPSIHTFNGSTADAELVITHSPISGGNYLFVCLPLMGNGSNLMLDTIIAAAANQAPGNGDSATISIDNYNLNSIIPKKPFYSYMDAQKNNWIVYGIERAISIAAQSVQDLNNIISSTADQTPPICPSGPLLYQNTFGPNSGNGENGDGEIYIDCRPTGNSEDTIEVTNIKPAINMDFSVSTILNNPIVIFLISSIFTILVLFLLYTLINFLSGQNTSTSIKNTLPRRSTSS